VTASIDLFFGSLNRSSNSKSASFSSSIVFCYWVYWHDSLLLIIASIKTPSGAPRRLSPIRVPSHDCVSADGPHVDRMSLLRALTHIAPHRPRTAPSCSVWYAHHPLPVASGPLQVAPITLHCGYWLKAPQLPAKSPHCTVRH
jgi:hypothetical protein